MGGSFSSNFSGQTADSTVTQTYSGTCNVVCNNSITDAQISVVNSTVEGNIDLTQVCSANMSCLQNNSQNSTSDVMFKAANSSTANPASWSTWVDPGQVSSSSNTAVQNIQQAINNAVTQNCNTTSTNSINRAQIFAQNSYIGGNVQITQTGTADASCSLSNQMTASAYASGTEDQCSSSGKALIPSCLMGKGGLGTAIGLLIAFIVIGFVVFGLWKYFHVPTCTSPGQPLGCKPPVCGTPGWAPGNCTPI